MEKFEVDTENTSSISDSYNSIQAGLIAATQLHHIIPDLGQLHAEFNFPDYMLPPTHSPVYESLLDTFISISRVLDKVLVDPEAFNSACIKIVHKVNTHSMETCGFKLLLKLLGAVIPHLGGEALDIVDEVSNIKLLPTSTCNSIFLDISKLMRRLHISRQYVPPTTLPNRYFNLMMKVLALRIHVAPNYRDFRSHIKSNGPNIPYSKSIEDIHNLLEASGVPMDKFLIIPKSANDDYFQLTSSAAFGNLVAIP